MSSIRWAGPTALVASLSLLAACGRGGAAGVPSMSAASLPVVGVVPVTRQTLRRTLKLAAEFKPYQDIAVDAKVAGYVQAIPVDVGDHVAAGQLLATLEVPELRDQIRQAEATIQQDQEGDERAQDLLAQAQAAHEAAHLDYTRLHSVFTTQPGLVAQQEVDDAHSRDEAAQAQVSAAEAALAGAKQQLAAAQAERARLQTLFGYTRITAPFAGVITQRFADTGAMIQAGTTQAMPIVRLAQENVLRLGIPVPESAVPQIHVGMPAEITVSSLNRTFAGAVARFADQVAFDTRTMYTEIDVPNPGGALVPGMYAYATLTLEQRPDAVAVPVEALNRGAAATTVEVVNAQHRLESRTVTLGLETPDAVEITAGVAPGDQVVVSGASLLKPGTAVEPKVVAPPAAPAGGAQ